jgi:hypothetical protein
MEDFIEDNIVLNVDENDLLPGSVQFVKRSELLKAIVIAYPRVTAIHKAKSADLKEKLDTVFASLGFPFHSQKKIGNSKYNDGYVGVCWIYQTYEK